MIKISGTVVDGNSNKIVKSVSYDNKTCDVVFELFNGEIKRKNITFGSWLDYAMNHPDDAYTRWFGDEK